MSKIQNLSTIVLSNVQNRPCTTSKDVATYFGKQHKHVIRDIEALIANTPESFHAPNFGLMFSEVEIGNGAKRQSPYYNIFFDGFIMLAMGYTGKKAIQIKLAYIEAFNKMKAQLEQQVQSQKPVYNLPPTQHTMVPEATITPADQNILQAIVRAKVSMRPNSQKKKSHYFALHWMKFNDHFRLGKYDQLPQSRMADAVIFLVTLDVLSPDKPTNMDSLDKFDRWAWKVEILRRQVQEAVGDLAQEGVFLLKVEDTGLAPFMWLVQVLRDWLQKVVSSVNNVIGDKYQAHYKMIELIRSLEIRLQAPGNRWGIDFK